MKKYLFCLILSFVCSGGFSQNILTFFETIPDSSLMGLSTTERKMISQRATAATTHQDAHYDPGGNSLHLSFEALDIRNGYIRLIGAFEGHIQMCYWNLKNGKKLIAVYGESCGPMCVMERFDFYEYDGHAYTSIAWYTIIPDIYGAFFTGDMDQQMEEMEQNDIGASLLFELPRSGKNIIARWGNEAPQEDYSPYSYGDRMKLIWNDGTFSRGEIYWE